MIIKGKEFKIIINVKKIKKIYVRVKIINNEYYIIINSYKKLSSREVEQLISNNPKAFDRLVNNIENINLLEDNQILILGNVYDKNNSKIKLELAYSKINDMFNKYKFVFNKKNTVLKFRKMKSRWGVCHITKNYITLSTFLVHVPLELIEYVIIHEFCHFKFPNHSKDFYKYVSQYCPDYKNKRKELKKFSYVLK